MVYDRKEPRRSDSGRHMRADLEGVRLPTHLNSFARDSVADSNCSYAENTLTEEEYASLPAATQDRVKRTGLAREMGPRYMNYGAADFPLARVRRIGEASYPNSCSYFGGC